MVMNKENAILIIDPQYDFCNRQGALYVEGADADMLRLAQWIKMNKAKIGHIAVTADSHPVNDISHPSFWQDKAGKFPDPFTPITIHDISVGKWTPRFFANEAVAYVETLEKQGEFGHFIWPYHCLTGSSGAAIADILMEALGEWALMGNFYHLITKGTYPVSEHFGIFRANVPVADHPETQLNIALIETLSQYERVFLAGEAKSHCVANSLKQAMDEAPELARKFIILEDCMSDVTGLGYLAEPIYNRARSMGILFAKSADLIL